MTARTRPAVVVAVIAVIAVVACTPRTEVLRRTVIETCPSRPPALAPIEVPEVPPGGQYPSAEAMARALERCIATTRLCQLNMRAWEESRAICRPGNRRDKR
ncbi:MAG: hypothetical protein OXU42_03985 [Deltaproteobacteria bacterium]|nr:hypothetical protein [Deltaproteobacteria bacterium]